MQTATPEPESPTSLPPPAAIAAASGDFMEALSFYIGRFLIILAGICVGIVAAFIVGAMLGWIEFGC